MLSYRMAIRIYVKINDCVTYYRDGQEYRSSLILNCSSLWSMLKSEKYAKFADSFVTVWQI